MGPRGLATAWFGGALTVEDRLCRWLLVLRVLVLADAVAVDLRGRGGYRHPGAVLGCLLVMTAWTAVAGWAYAEARRRGPVLLGLDLALAVGLVLLTPVLKGPVFFATVPGFWVVGASMAWAVRYRWAGGLLAGAVLAAADLSVRTGLDQANTGNLFLLLVSGPIVGFMVESLVRMAAERDAAQAVAVAATERARLGRIVHDGVLQVLALTHREGGELGRLAGEQERALRLLVREQDAVPQVPAAATAEVDLVAALLPLGARPAVEIVSPGAAVLLPAALVAELAAAVAACLDNVARHAGPDAQAWVGVEDDGTRVCVSVRDDGVGIPAGRLDRAAADGRLGVSQSIRGRLADLGGTADLVVGGPGTEWELAVPRRTADSSP